MGPVASEVGQGLGIGFRGKAVTRALELGAQQVGVLDDAVVHDGKGTRTVGVRMGVALGGRAVRRPAGVADAASAGERRAPKEVPQALHTSRELACLHTMAIQHRDADGVVAAVLEPGEALHQHGRRFPRTHIAHDAAHPLRSPSPGFEQRPPYGPEAEAGEMGHRVPTRLNGSPAHCHDRGAAHLAGVLKGLQHGTFSLPAVLIRPRLTSLASHARTLEPRALLLVPFKFEARVSPPQRPRPSAWPHNALAHADDTRTGPEGALRRRRNV